MDTAHPLGTPRRHVQHLVDVLVLKTEATPTATETVEDEDTVLEEYTVDSNLYDVRQWLSRLIVWATLRRYEVSIVLSDKAAPNFYPRNHTRA